MVVGPIILEPEVGTRMDRAEPEKMVETADLGTGLAWLLLGNTTG